MKIAGIIAKILVALAAVAGAVYVIATYGNQIVAWAKKVLASLPCGCCREEADAECGEVEEVAAEVAEEAPAEEVATEEAPVEEAAPVAEEADFEG
ncbi:MAG: hypothetical protein J6Q53_04570 [Oscillospiraceae bacterium]|nr:hypothetical protein [Oscillospiraceae bacterium]